MQIMKVDPRALKENPDRSRGWNQGGFKQPFCQERR